MPLVLTDIETRVLGSLIEKDITTPDYYPLSLNALINACNQKSNRDPVMNLDEEAVRDALLTLNQKGLAGTVSSADSRVPKYEHRLQEAFNLPRAETATLCVLLLRGAQTPGELRGRSERMHRFEELSDVHSALQRLIQRDQPLVRMLPRQPGTKEARYAHLLSGDVEIAEPPAPQPTSVDASVDGQRIVRLENEIDSLRAEIDDLKKDFREFQKRFE